MHHPELQREISTGTTGAQNSGQKGVIGTYDGTIKTARPVRQTVPQGMGFLLLKSPLFFIYCFLFLLEGEGGLFCFFVSFFFFFFENALGYVHW